MAVNLSPVGGVAAQFFTNTGAVLTGGKIYTYAAGTTTPQTTFTSSGGGTAWANPIVLDAAGRVSGSGEIWLTDGITYKFVLKDTNDVLIATYDNISGINSNSVSFTNQQEIITATAGQTVFNLSISYQVGTNSLSVFVDGVNQYGPGAQYAYTETDSDTVTFTSGLHVGAEVKFTTTQQQGAGAVDASQVSYTPAGTGAVTTNVQTKLRQSVSVQDFGAACNGVTDDTAAIQAALNSGAQTVLLSLGTSIINGTLTIPAGVTLRGVSVASEYFPTGPGSTTVGSQLYKPNATGSAGPIVILQSSSGLADCYLRHAKVGGATTGIVQVGLSGNYSVYNSNISNVSIYGDATTDLTSATTCYGIFYPDGSTPSNYQRYFNRANNFYITNCDVAIRLGANCNANTFSSFVTRQCYQHILLDGVASNQQTVENVFSGFACHNIGVLPTSPTTVFVLKNYAIYNCLTGYSTECNGAAFSIDTTSTLNTFLGNENETTLSVVPVGNVHSLWAQPANRSQNSQIIIPAVATPLNYTEGTGNSVHLVQAVGGSLPQLAGTGALVAANANSRVFARFSSNVYTKALRIGFFATLRVALNAPGGTVGDGFVEVDFWYRVTDNSTNAAQLSVISVNSRPASNYIAGLKFLTGVASGLGFGLAIVGGNYLAVSSTRLLVDLKITAFTHDTNTITMANLASVAWNCAAATTNDVTDAIDLLTVGDTTV